LIPSDKARTIFMLLQFRNNLMVGSFEMRLNLLAVCILSCNLRMVAQTSGTGATADRKVDAQRFESGIGFSYDVPSNLTILTSKSFDSAVRSEASREAGSSQEKKSINCTQQLLAAENRDESRIINFVASSQGCATGIVTENTIDKLGQYGAGEMAKRFAFTKSEYGKFSAGQHKFWVMRSEMAPNPPRNPNRNFVLLITFTPDAVIECMILARTASDMEALTETHIKFDDETESELVPASAFAAKN
jgi:hypothetical protein